MYASKQVNKMHFKEKGKATWSHRGDTFNLLLVFATFLAKSSKEVIGLKDLPSFVHPRPFSWLVVDPRDPYSDRK